VPHPDVRRDTTTSPKAKPVLTVSVLPTIGDWWDLISIPLAMSPGFVGVQMFTKSHTVLTSILLVGSFVPIWALIWPRLAGVMECRSRSGRGEDR
jgi:hypothetical protein